MRLPRALRPLADPTLHLVLLGLAVTALDALFRAIGANP